MTCPACKIIIDGGVLAASARLYGRAYTESRADFREDMRGIVGAAEYLAAIAEASTEALMQGIRTGKLTSDQIDEAHAMSELSCHRAAWLRERAEASASTDFGHDAVRRLREWAEELRLHTTKLIGGEYRGAWTVDGVDAIRRDG
jgi:hypothetical protein